MEINVPLTILLKLVYIMKMRIPTAALTLTPEKKAHQVSVLSQTIMYQWALGYTLYVGNISIANLFQVRNSVEMLTMLNDCITLVNQYRLDSQNANL